MERSPAVARALEYPLVTTLLRGAHAALASSRGIGKTPGAAAAADFSPQISVNSVVLARLIARESDALFPGTAPMLADDVTAGLLVRLDCDAPAMRTNPGVIYLRDRTLAPAAKFFIETLRAVEEEARLREPAAGRPPRATARRPGRKAR
jgi:DNA-binding transcriptional LysR family regulator